MNEMLTKLKKVVDRAVDTRASIREVALAAFPGHVLKALEVILADPDEDRAAHRLARLKASVDEACTIAKQGMDEDLAALRVRVVVYEEPAGTPAGEGGGSRPPAQDLGQAIETLQGEVAALKRTIGEPPGVAKAGVAEEARAPGTGDEDGNARTAKADAPGNETEEDEADEDDDEERKAKAKEKRKRKGKGESKQVAKAVAWPLDLNTATASAAPAAAALADADFDWGTDPDLGPAGR